MRLRQPLLTPTTSQHPHHKSWLVRHAFFFSLYPLTKIRNMSVHSEVQL